MNNSEDLIKGSKIALRLWDETNVFSKQPIAREYEVVGYVLEGTALLDLDGKEQQLNQGDSYLVPAGVKHKYQIDGRFRSIEATSV